MKRVAQNRSRRATVDPGPTASIAPGGKPPLAWDRYIWLVAIPLALVVIYAFLPILNNGFVTWDDDENFLENPYFRGLGLAQVKWAWTTFWVGAYQPLTWMLFETQYVFCQLDPRGYHLTSLLLQVANTVVVYLLTVALLVRCQADSEQAVVGGGWRVAGWESPSADIGPGRENSWTIALGAGLATALFAVHPLRVETVAWATCQSYLACVLFSVLSVLAYLRAFPVDSAPRRGWLVGSFLLFMTALLFHALAVSLPAVLLILDVYPLRRIPDESGHWIGASARRALLEKLPFLMTSILFLGLAIAAKPRSRFPVEHYGVTEGIAQACYGIWLYIVKTVLPRDLIVFYPLPKALNWLEPPYSLSILATLATTAGLLLARWRWPGLLAAWLSYLVILAPNSGIIRISDQIAADRYSYMSMLGFVMLTAAGLRLLWRTTSRWNPGAIGLIASGLGALAVLTSLTRSQCRTWLDAETLWTHALAHGATDHYLPHNKLGVALRTKGNYQAAETQYTEAIRLNPGYIDAHYNLGNVLSALGKYQAAAARYAETIRLDPDYYKAHYNWGILLSAQRNYDAAATHFTEASRLNPSLVAAYFNLGLIHAEQGKYERALAEYAQAIQLKPNDPNPYNASAMIMAACPDPKFRDATKAIQFATHACTLTNGKDPRFHDTLAAAYAEAGDFEAAITSQRRAIELLTDQRRKDDYRSRLLLYQARRPYRQVTAQPRPD